MSHEIRHITLPNLTDLWATVYKNDSGTFKVNINGGDTWEVWSDPNIDNYDITMTDKGHGVYTCDFPATIVAAGIGVNAYLVVVYQGPKTSACYPVGYYYIEWDGTGIIADVVSLSAAGLDNVRKAEPAGAKASWTFTDWLNYLMRGGPQRNKTILTQSDGAGSLQVRNDADDGDLATHVLDKTGNTLTIDPPV